MFVSKRFQSLTGQESLSFCLSAASANNSSSSSATAAATSQPQSSNASSPSVTVADLDALKREILTEVRREILQAKQEIVEGLSDFVGLSEM